MENDERAGDAIGVVEAIVTNKTSGDRPAILGVGGNARGTGPRCRQAGTLRRAAGERRDPNDVAAIASHLAYVLARSGDAGCVAESDRSPRSTSPSRTPSWLGRTWRRTGAVPRRSEMRHTTDGSIS